MTGISAESGHLALLTLTALFTTSEICKIIQSQCMEGLPCAKDSTWYFFDFTDRLIPKSRSPVPAHACGSKGHRTIKD